MPFGFSFDMNITNSCNIKCKHCYMEKNALTLTDEQAECMLDRLPLTLNKLVISGGEPYVNYKILYHIIDYSRKRFGDSHKIRISTNGVAMYETDLSIESELCKLSEHRVNELMISIDSYHIDAGVNRDRLLRISEIAIEKSLPIKVRYLNIGKGTRIGQFDEGDESLVAKSKC